MNAAIKAKWLDALRSGKYEQGAKRLRRNDAYCCLGVLCDLHAKTTGSGEWGTFHLGSNDYITMDGGKRERQDGVLPGAVYEWAGLATDDPVVYEGLTLSQFNDGDDNKDDLSTFREPKTFAEIADLIEAYL